jgi:hypothetical protein
VNTAPKLNVQPNVNRGTLVSTIPDQRKHPRAAASVSLCVDVLPETVLTVGILWAGVEVFASWQIALIATVPAAFAAREIHTSRKARRHYAMATWLTAERRWQIAQAVRPIAAIEDTNSDRLPRVVDGHVVEPRR